jgi:glycosyltransferase involved in cell wall biosynthesis
MNIFVMPSVYESETFGIAAIEAQAMGVPVIATKVGGIPEAVKDGITGILVPPRDPKSIAEAILKLISDKSLMESMSCEGPRFVAENFDWQKNAGRVEELYESLLLRYRK